MTVTLVPLPDGLIGEAEERLRYIIHAINGYAGQGIRFNLTEYNHAERYALQVRNTDTPGGGLHFAVYLSSSSLASSPTPIFEVQDAGVFFEVAAVMGAGATITGSATITGGVTVGGNATVGGSLTTVGDVFVGDTLFVDEGVDIIGGGEISGTVVFHGQIQSTLTTGTAPFSVLSTTLVSNLNADLLDGFHASHFATPSDIDSAIDALDDIYVDQDGDTMSGRLNVAIANDQAIGVRHTSSSEAGYWTIGATSTTDPAMVFKSHGGFQALLLADSSYTYQVEVYDNLYVNDSVQVNNDITIGNSSTGVVLHNNGNAEIWGSTDIGTSSANTHVVRGSIFFDDDVEIDNAPQLNTGSGAGFAVPASYSGYFTVKDSGGVNRKVPYHAF